MREPKRTLSTLCGVSLAYLLMLLAGCGTLPSLLPTSRVVVSCPPELGYRPVKVFPPLPEPLTNRGLEEFALSLVVQIRQTWAAVEQSQNDCAEWLRSQGVK